VVGDDGTGALKGRAKFCRPMFKAISEVDKSLARDFYGRFKEGFHPIARKMIEKVSEVSHKFPYDTHRKLYRILASSNTIGSCPDVHIPVYQCTREFRNMVF
jgi:hypothetical protein